MTDQRWRSVTSNKEASCVSQSVGQSILEMRSIKNVATSKEAADVP